MKILTATILVSVLFTNAGCERIAWEVYSYQTKERCAQYDDNADYCYQTAMEWFELDGTRLNAEGYRIPMERRYPD